MGLCAPAKSDASIVERPGQAILSVWGDQFQPETRTIMIMIKIGAINHEFHPIDQFKGDHKKEDYQKLNPTGSIPTLKEGRFLILGGYRVFISYLVNHHRLIRDKLYQREEKQNIDVMLSWFQSIMRSTTQKLIRMVIAPQAFGEKQPTRTEIEAQLNEFFDSILPIVEQKLSKTEYICGEDTYSIADIVLYNEISTVLTLHQQKIDSYKLPNVFDWFNRIGQLPEIMESDNKFKEIAANYNFI